MSQNLNSETYSLLMRRLMATIINENFKFDLEIENTKFDAYKGYKYFQLNNKEVKK